MPFYRRISRRPLVLIIAITLIIFPPLLWFGFLYLELGWTWWRFNQIKREGNYFEAMPYAERFIELAENKLGKTDGLYSVGLNNLAHLYVYLGRYTEAEPLHKRALTNLEKTNGPEHRIVAIALNNLALLYFRQGRYAEA